MPKEPRKKFYAVLFGRGAPFVTDSSERYRDAMSHFSGASGKGFFTEQQAQRWLDEARGVTASADHSGQGEPELKTAPHVVAERCPQSGCEIPQRAKPVVSDIVLSEEQRDILEIVKGGGNVFFTGPAGTGKSVLLRAIIIELRKWKPEDAVAVTATTGIAALAIGGRTIHSYAGVKYGKEPAEQLLNRVRSSTAAERWRSTEVLILDEISMLGAELFDKLEYIARKTRHNRRPFGGIQLILTGDFFQLPPVPGQSYEHRSPGQFTFHAESWHQCVPLPYFLRRVFRQKDKAFIDILSSARLGSISQEQADLLRKLERPLVCQGGLEPASLFPIRDEVAEYNAQRLNELTGAEHTYLAMDCAGWTVRRTPVPVEAAARLLEKYSTALEKVSLKVGAQVMLIKNVEQGKLVNGSMGRVIDFLTVREAMDRLIRIAAPRERDEAEEEALLRRLVSNPPRQPFQSTSHQLAHLVENVPDLVNRPTGLRPLTNRVFDLDQKWPLVVFSDNLELLCAPLNFEIVGYMGNIEAHRMQVPLILSWAISMHKSQGQTLDYVSVDFRSVFEHGQAYVALSRATSMEGLQVVNFDPAMIRAHPQVVRWHEYWESWWGSQKQCAEEMDTDEAVRRFWEDSQQDVSESSICVGELCNSPLSVA